MKQNRAPHTSCSQCLAEFLEFEPKAKDHDWEALGMKEPQCRECIEALKSRHMLSSTKADK